MDCHESLMQRRRKRTRGAASKKSSSQAKLDKSLPSLPPHLMAEAQNDAFVDSPSDGLRSRDTPGASDAGRSETSPSRQASGKKAAIDHRWDTMTDSFSLHRQPHSSFQHLPKQPPIDEPARC